MSSLRVAAAPELELVGLPFAITVTEDHGPCAGVGHIEVRRPDGGDGLRRAAVPSRGRRALMWTCHVAGCPLAGVPQPSANPSWALAAALHARALPARTAPPRPRCGRLTPGQGRAPHAARPCDETLSRCRYVAVAFGVPTKAA